MIYFLYIHRFDVRAHLDYITEEKNNTTDETER